ncbi:hypothetical protein [Novipirellula aureliae]|nr:hypothetical protein [Novipirellula aureliae]
MKFAQVIRSSSKVRRAFDAVPVLRTWWRLILSLHGKPVCIDRTSQSTSEALVNGFRFYGYLYSALAIVLLLISPLMVIVAGTASYLWAILTVTSSAYLACTSQLAFFGARCYADEPDLARPLLVSFFASIIAWLASVLSGCIVAIHFVVPQYEVVLALGIGTVLVMGVGSYFIELIYISCE